MMLSLPEKLALVLRQGKLDDDRSGFDGQLPRETGFLQCLPARQSHLFGGIGGDFEKNPGTVSALGRWTFHIAQGPGQADPAQLGLAIGLAPEQYGQGFGSTGSASGDDGRVADREEKDTEVRTVARVTDGLLESG